MRPLDLAVYTMLGSAIGSIVRRLNEPKVEAAMWLHVTIF
jgi:hypothetical protein